MELQEVLDNIQDFSDLELAVLLSLVAKQHCLVEADDDLIDDVASELALIVSEVFKLSYVILEEDDLLSVDQFGETILDNDANYNDFTDAYEGSNMASKTISSRLSAVAFKSSAQSQMDYSKLDSRRTVNVVIAKNFNLAQDDVQIQALELIRRRRIYSRTTVHAAPSPFLFLPLVANSSKSIRLQKYLNDRIFMSHCHGSEDGFPNLEELEGASRHDDRDSTRSYSASSVVKHSGLSQSRQIETKVIDLLREKGEATTITPEIRRYLHDVVAFLRIERGVDGGVSPFATTAFVGLAKYLAPLHGIDYVTPSLVAMSAKKVYPHRVIIASPERERSTLYGTDLASAKEILRGLTPEMVIQAALDAVECPA